MEKSRDNLTTDELRLRVQEYGTRLNESVSCKVEFDINLKILDHLYVQLISAIQNNSTKPLDNPSHMCYTINITLEKGDHYV